MIDPAYGFSCVVDVSRLGASAQELTVALCRRRVAVYPGDGLGEVGATTTIRLNLSDPDPSALARFAAALPEAAAEAASGIYRDGRPRPVPLLRHRRAAGGSRSSSPGTGAVTGVEEASPGRAAAGSARGSPGPNDAVIARDPGPSSKTATPSAKDRSTAPGWMPVTSSASTARSSPGTGGGRHLEDVAPRSPVSGSRLSMVTGAGHTADDRAPRRPGRQRR